MAVLLSVWLAVEINDRDVNELYNYGAGVIFISSPVFTLRLTAHKPLLNYFGIFGSKSSYENSD